MTSSLVTGGRLTGLHELTGIGVDPVRGGYSRHLWQEPDLQMRAWFVQRAEALGLSVEHDRNGNIWAWLGEPGPDAVVTGSHLDSVPGGGEFDGPLGIVVALDAVARLQAAGNRLTRPLAVVAFAEEEGSRFGIACMGSRLMTGELAPDRARALRDEDGVSFAEAAERVGFDARQIGRDGEALGRIGVFVEVHVEQGRGLIELGSPIAVASSIFAHGRWMLTFRGQGNHAGATAMGDRDDPMVAAARAVLEIEQAALAAGDARATVGRVSAVPGGTNVIASRVELSLDARSEEDADVRDLIADIARRVGASEFAEQSWSGAVRFDEGVRDRLRTALGDVPVLPTGAGHDAGVLAGTVPTAMVFVRNPTGISHAPAEFAEAEDCLAGIDALVTVLEELQ